jgi:hypothetical protein
MIKDNKHAINDAIGLTKAYEDGDTHIIGNTMYIAGTHTKRDAYNDITKKSHQFYVMHPITSQH